MEQQSLQKNSDLLRGQLQYNVSLADYIAYRAGGLARVFYQPHDRDDLMVFLSLLPPDEQVLWLGLGSNMLIRDKGYNGTVITTLCDGFNDLAMIDEFTVRAGAGVSCAKVARFCARLGLSGGEFLAGIPGTIGGALAMNAGCFGSETWELVVGVETVTRLGEYKQREPSAYKVAYREVICPENECFVAGYFRLKSGNKEESLEKIRELLERRARTQPTGDFTCGSVFRNPPGDYAARLIEVCGLKGLRQGGAFVSEKHANFIVNEGTASASDIEYLINTVAKEIQAKFGITLIREVKIIGEE